MSLAIEPMPDDEPHPIAEPRTLWRDDVALESIADTVGHAAGAVDGLRDVLERLNSSISRVQEERSTEVRLGLLFTQAQEFLNSAIADARQRAAVILRDAAIEAERIISDGSAEAARLVEAGKEEVELLLKEAEQRSLRDGEALKQLEATIAVFNRVNGELVAELSLLQEALGGTEQAEVATLPALDELGLELAADASLSDAIEAATEPDAPTELDAPTQLDDSTELQALTEPDASTELDSATELEAASELDHANEIDHDQKVSRPHATDLSGSWMYADNPPWERPSVYVEPRRRFWRR